MESKIGKKDFLFPAGTALLWLVLFVSCGGASPYRIGFLGGLTGKLSDLGVSGRNGTLLAVEEANAAGGVNGREILLTVADDKQDPEAGREAFEELARAKVVAVVGPMTSDIALAVTERATAEKIVLVSPTASTKKLTGLDDYFLRVNPQDTSESRDLASFSVRSGFKRVVVVYDLANRTFSEGVLENFIAEYTYRGGGKVIPLSFMSAPGISYGTILASALREQPDAIMIIAGALDTAGLCQQLVKEKVSLPVMGNGWAMTKALFENGGPAVEGLLFSHYFDQDSADPRFREFVGTYEKRFGKEPDFVAWLAYDAARIIFAALERDPGVKDLKKSILAGGTFPGLQGGITLNSFGDAELQRYLLRVKNGRIERYE